jgi:hypothetical protein
VRSITVVSTATSLELVVTCPQLIVTEFLTLPVGRLSGPKTGSARAAVLVKDLTVQNPAELGAIALAGALDLVTRGRSQLNIPTVTWWDSAQWINNGTALVVSAVDSQYQPQPGYSPTTSTPSNRCARDPTTACSTSR